MRARRDEEFEQYVRDRRGALLRTATAITGGDRHLAEDVVQVTLVRLYRAWPRRRPATIDAYVRRILVNVVIDEKRRPAHRHENTCAAPPDRPSSEAATGVDAELLAGLRSLSPGMRAAVVLRHVEGLSVEQTAHALRCRPGNVKSQTARGLDRLRAFHLASTTTTTTAESEGEDLCTN